MFYIRKSFKTTQNLHQIIEKVLQRAKKPKTVQKQQFSISTKTKRLGKVDFIADSSSWNKDILENNKYSTWDNHSLK